MKNELRSAFSTQGRRMAGARALWRANGMKEEQIGKPIIAIVNSFTQFVPGHVHLHKIGQLVKKEIEANGNFVMQQISSIFLNTSLYETDSHTSTSATNTSRSLCVRPVEICIYMLCRFPKSIRFSPDNAFFFSRLESLSMATSVLISFNAIRRLFLFINAVDLSFVIRLWHYNADITASNLCYVLAGFLCSQYICRFGHRERTKSIFSNYTCYDISVMLRIALHNTILELKTKNHIVCVNLDYAFYIGVSSISILKQDHNQSFFVIFISNSFSPFERFFINISRNEFSPTLPNFISFEKFLGLIISNHDL